MSSGPSVMTSNDVRVAPSPAGDHLTVIWTEADALQADIQIFNLTGQNIYSKENVAPDTEIDVHDFVPGVYLLRWTSGTSGQTIKWVKM